MLAPLGEALLGHLNRWTILKPPPMARERASNAADGTASATRSLDGADIETGPAPEVQPGQVASTYPEGRPAAGAREGARATDPPAGSREAGAWEMTPENVARMERGQPPLGADGQPVQLHHRDQSSAGPLDEMSAETHRTVDHPNSPSEIDRNQFAGERRRYWVDRIRELFGQGQGQ